ncbi:hypothetical protein [Alkalihalobacillus sp. 1P02AB]|uniref:hypothetical protein n=1 Tax=Alkalihalobacillus sp. 1P02AB TaxID=3132260 RepID=UPI0039A7252B
MSSCKLDHPLEDVKAKLASQQQFLPSALYQKCTAYLETERSQVALNELFHLLKKYDLADSHEQLSRNEKISKLIEG